MHSQIVGVNRALEGGWVMLQPWSWADFSRPNDTQHNDTQHNDTQHNDTQHNDTLHNDTLHNGIQHNNNNWNATLSITTLSIMALNEESCCAGCHLCGVSLMPRVTNKPFMLSVIMLYVGILSVIMLNAVAPFPKHLTLRILLKPLSGNDLDWFWILAPMEHSIP